MIISDSHRLLFVHIQKTGGSSIDGALRAVLPDVRVLPELGRHAPLRRILRVEPELASYWIVGTVRNPWSRMLSWYRMIDRFRRMADSGRAESIAYLRRNQFAAKVARDHRDFESFVLEGPDRFLRLSTPQVRYLRTATRCADFVGRQETLSADVAAIAARLGLPPVELPRVNVDRMRPAYQEMYTPPMRRRVAEVFQRDIDTFGYHFDQDPHAVPPESFTR